MGRRGIEIEEGAAVASARQVKSIGYLAPFWIGRRAEGLGRFDGSFETLARDLVGVYLVVDIGVVLLRRCHSENLVPMLGRIEGRSAAPEIGYRAHDRERTILEPGSIVSREIVLPLRQCHGAVHVNLAIGILNGEGRSDILAAPWIRLPGVHCSRESMRLRSRERLRQTALAKLNQGFGPCRMQQQQ